MVVGGGDAAGCDVDDEVSKPEDGGDECKGIDEVAVPGGLAEDGEQEEAEGDFYCRHGEGVCACRELDFLRRVSHVSLK